MWNTSDGERKPKGAERALLVEAVVGLNESLLLAAETDGIYEVGVPVFDSIPNDQRSLVLLSVAERLLGDEPAPDLFAWNDGVILALFTHVKERLEIEVGDPKGGAYWRKLVQEAWMENCFSSEVGETEDDQGPNQPIDSADTEGWWWKVNCLAELILYDSDCDDDTAMDLPAEEAGELKRRLGIEEDYYTAVPPRFSDEDKARLQRFHVGLVREISESE